MSTEAKTPKCWCSICRNDKHAAGESNEKRRHGRTSRTNWRFWLQRDCEKVLSILKAGGNIPTSIGYFQPDYRLYPTATEVVTELTETKDKQLYIDIETDENFGLKCIGYSFDSDRISVVPIIDFNYKPAYHEITQILRAFSLAFENNTVVSHNGAGFGLVKLKKSIKIN